MLGLLGLVFSLKFVLGAILGAGGIVIYLTIIGNKIVWKKVK